MIYQYLDTSGNTRHMSVSIAYIIGPKCEPQSMTTRGHVRLVNGTRLQSLPVPNYRWEVVTLDIIPALPTTKHGNDALGVFTEKLTTLIICVPDKTTIDGPGCAKLFFEHVFRHHGLPTVIISDRDPRFTSTFWKTLFSLTGTRLNMSSSNHPHRQTGKPNE